MTSEDVWDALQRSHARITLEEAEEIEDYVAASCARGFPIVLELPTRELAHAIATVRGLGVDCRIYPIYPLGTMVCENEFMPEKIHLQISDCYG